MGYVNSQQIGNLKTYQIGYELTEGVLVVCANCMCQN